MFPLLISLTSLYLGVIAYPIIRRYPLMMAGMDGLVLITVGGLALFHLIPQSLALGGWGALALVIAGFFIPSIFERLPKMGDGNERSLPTWLWLALIGLAAHTFLDGIALAPPPANHPAADTFRLLSLSVVVHQLPIGVVVGWMLFPLMRLRSSLAVVTLVALANVAGFFVGLKAGSQLRLDGFALFQAFMAGTLLHVIYEHPITLSEHRLERARLTSAIGCLLGILLLMIIQHAENDSSLLLGSRSAPQTFVLLAREAAPALILAFIGAALLRTFFSEPLLNWMSRGSTLGQTLRGVAFGLPLPVCSCGVMPIYQSLVRSGIPAASGLAFLVATPEIGIDAALLSVPLLGPHLTLIRMLAAAIAAISVALIVQRFIPHPNHQRLRSPLISKQARPALASLWKRCKERLPHELQESVLHTMPWILVGLMIAAIADPTLNRNWFEDLPNVAEVPLMGLIGMPIYVCASGSTPLVAVLLSKGLSPGAAIAFLLTGPATNVSSFGMLSRLHGRKVAIAFGCAMSLVATVIGYAVNFFWSNSPILELQTFEHQQPGLLSTIALTVVALLVLFSLFRHGPRGLLQQLRTEPDPCDCDHTHDAATHQPLKPLA